SLPPSLSTHTHTHTHTHTQYVVDKKRCCTHILNCPPPPTHNTLFTLRASYVVFAHTSLDGPIKAREVVILRVHVYVYTCVCVYAYQVFLYWNLLLHL